MADLVAIRYRKEQETPIQDGLADMKLAIQRQITEKRSEYHRARFRTLFAMQ
jgi:hypothetical protein